MRAASTKKSQKKANQSASKISLGEIPPQESEAMQKRAESLGFLNAEKVAQIKTYRKKVSDVLNKSWRSLAGATNSLSFYEGKRNNQAEWPLVADIPVVGRLFVPITQAVGHIVSTVILIMIVLLSFVQGKLLIPEKHRIIDGVYTDISTVIERHFPAFYYLFPQPPDRRVPAPSTGITEEQNRILAHSHVRKFHRDLINPKKLVRRNSFQVPNSHRLEEHHNDVEVVDDDFVRISETSMPPSFLKRIASNVSEDQAGIGNVKTKSINYDGRLAKMNVKYYVEYEGFTCETYHVTTADGFVLQLDRICPGPNMDKMSGPPVILMHGLFQSAGVWVSSGHHSFGFYLARNNYDVWLANNRTCSAESKEKHISLSWNDPEFWNWCLDDLAKYDIPAIVDAVRGHTGWHKVGFVGHSQGNSQMFLALSMDTSLNEKLSVFIALAPAVYMGSLLNAFPVNLLIGLEEKWFRRIFGINQFLPIMNPVQSLLPPNLVQILGYHMFHFLFDWFVRYFVN
ncbi:hypothetical protein HDU84_001218 [Entophlyctis sp. JEL0112]|nr:hypothetical protein HDU84_001218 [Entophlyctis sp. JEL0112]